MAMHTIEASAATIQHGLTTPQATPILTIGPGDTVILDAWAIWDNAAGPKLDVEQALAVRDLRAEGRGPHTSTGACRGQDGAERHPCSGAEGHLQADSRS